MNIQTVAIMQVSAPATALLHVLAVDDDPVIREAIADYLNQHEFRVTAVADGAAMQELLSREVIDLVVLDLKLQAEDGMALARRLRDESAIPLIMLTGRREEADRVMGLELGADDYLTKPFSPRELLARIRAVLRRRRPEVQQGRPEGIRAYRFDGWELNLNTRRLMNRDGQAVPLSNGEFSLLIVFLGAPHRILSRDQLIDMSRLHNDDVYNRSVNTQVMRTEAQARDRSRETTLHPYRARRGVHVRRPGRNGLLTGRFARFRSHVVPGVGSSSPCPLRFAPVASPYCRNEPIS
jgi:DNA-binding response OmpR family regulator